MADVDITSLSVEISAESSGAELNIDKLATAISNLRTKGNVTKVVNSLDKLSASISTLKQASTGLSGLDNITNFFNGIGNANFSGSVKSINSVVNAIKKIPAAVSGLNGVDFYSMSGSITQLTNAMAPLSILDASGLKAIGSAVNAIGKIPDLSEKLKAADLDAFSDSCNKISTALTPLASQLDKVGNAFAKLPLQLSKVVTQANRVTKANEKAGKSYLSLSSQMNGFMKRAAQLVSLKAIAQYIGNAVVKFNDYYEAANLFGVSMKNLTGEASTFINKMEDLLGIDPTEAMNNMATIQSLTTSFGLASDKAYVLSKNLTQLGYDLASLKNIPVAESFTKIQAAISGELEPIRRLGVDLSQARLQQELYALGVTKSVSKLSQADKAVLRYIAIMKQTTDAQGDFARTISSPANQIRVLQAQLESLGRAVGSVLYPALSSILPPLIAAVELVKELVQWIAKLMGVKVEFPDFSNASADIGGVSDALDDTTNSTKKAAKALKDYTMGFDELNIIDPTQGSSGSGSGSGATGNILGDVDLSGYDMFKDYVGNSVDEIKAKLEKLAPLISGIAAGFATWAIGSALMDALSTIKKDGSLIKGIISLWKSPLMGAAVAVGIMAARFVDLYQNCESFRLGLVRVKELIDVAAQGLQKGFNESLTNGKLGESIQELKDSLSGLRESFLNLLPEEVRNKIKQLDLDIGDLIVTLVGIGLTISGHPVAGLAVLGFEAITVAVRGLGDTSASEMADMASDWKSKFEQIGQVAGDVLAFLIKGLADLIADIQTFLRWVSEGPTEAERLDVSMNQGFIANALLGFADLISDIKTFVEWVVDLGKKIVDAAKSFADFLGDVQNWAVEAGKAAAEMVNAVADAIKSLPSKMFEAGKNIWQGLVNGIKNGIDTVTGAAGNLAKAVIDKFTTDTEIHSPSALFARYGEYIDQGLANGITGALGYVQAAMTQLVGAVTEKGQELINAGYTGASNYVTNFLNGLDAQWEQIDSSLQNDFLGSVQTLANALQNGDLESLGKWAASYFYHAMDDEQKKQILSIANGALSQLKSNLSGVWQNIAGMAASFIGKLVPATTAATASQIGLNVAMDANPIMLVISLIGMLVGFLINLAGTNSNVAGAMGKVWKGLSNVMSFVFENIVRWLGLFIDGFVMSINTVIRAYNAVARLFGGNEISYVKNPLFEYADQIAASRKASNSASETVDNIDRTQVPGTREYEQATGSGSGSSYASSGSSSNGLSEEELRRAVYNGTYNAFLDIYQRYEGQDSTPTFKVYLDGRQITSTVEKTQSERGISIMGREVYSY